MNATAAISSVPARAYIGGEWCSAATAACFSVSDPATGLTIAEVADCGADETENAIEAAATALPAWRERPAQERADLLLEWYRLMHAEEDRLAAIITAEMGKPLAESVGEIRYGASYLRWYAEEAVRIYGEVIPSPDRTSRQLVMRQPVGVCAAITPWNFPNAMLMRKVAAALAAGCTIVAKPAEDTPLSALAMAEMADRAGIPAGAFNVVPTSRAADVGAVLTSSPIVRKLSFTGSTEVGRKLLSQCAPTVKRTSMELGGNAPFLVFADADLDAAVAGAMASKYRNAGQTCVCANRFFVQREIYDEFCVRLSEAAASMPIGPGSDPQSQIGPLINAAALEKVETLVADAITNGARVVTGGESKDGLFYAPTVLADVDPAARIVREEIFGPVAPIIPFDDESEAIAAANDTPYGLAAYCYTRDLGRAFRVSEALEYGMVGINEGIISSVSAPFGGVKQSGMGREGSRHGIDDYLEMKYIRMGGLAK